MVPKRTAPILTKWSVERQLEAGKDAFFPGGGLAGFGMRVGIKGRGLCIVRSHRALSQDNCHHVLPAEHGQERPDVRPNPCPPPLGKKVFTHVGLNDVTAFRRE